MFLACFGMQLEFYLYFFKVKFAGETKDDEVQSQSAPLGHRGSRTGNHATRYAARRDGGRDGGMNR